jgi:hypothetical protein
MYALLLGADDSVLDSKAVVPVGIEKVHMLDTNLLPLLFLNVTGVD